MRQPIEMEMEIMVRGNEIHQNAIDLGFELFLHWSQYRRNFHREIDNEANDIDIFQYWLLLWMKIIDAIHDFMSHRADAEHTEKKKSVNHFMEKMMSKTGIKFERNIAYYRGIGTFCFKDNKFITTKISKNYQNELIQSLDNIGTIFTKIS